MVIKVNTSELQSKSSYGESIASKLGEEASQINSLYYNIDPKVRSRQAIGSSMKSLQQRLERAQQKMYNISNFLGLAAARYSDAESIIIARLNGLDAVSAAYVDFTSGVSESKKEGKKWYNSNAFKIAVGVAVIGIAVAAVVLTGGAAIAVGAAVGAAIGAAGGGVVGGVVNTAYGGSFMDGFANGFMAGAIGGAISGAVGPTKIGFWGAAAIDGGTDSLIYTVQTLQNDGQVTIGGLATSFAIGMGISAISSGISSRIRNGGGSVADDVKVTGKSQAVEGAGKVISEVDRLKLSKWKYAPTDELYLKFKKVFDNPKYYDQLTGDIKWPINDGFEGVASNMSLKKGMRIDRYGFEIGTFVSPQGTPYGMRALAPGTSTKPYHVYEVVKPINCLGGKIASWFDEVGGGVQYKMNKTIQELLDEGYIKEVFD